jgi:diketogulonate reductase-like aldo/keto reductase
MRPLRLKNLGKTGSKIPEIGFGSWQSRSIDGLNLAIELGAGFIDTAEMYGTEEMVGKAIKDRREEVFLATKVSPEHFRYDDVLKAAELSLHRLDTTYIDLYQLHWPSRNIPITETMRAMEKLARDGKIRFIGISNFSVQQSREAQSALAREQIVSNQVEYNLLNRDIEKDLLPYCEKERITIIAYSPLARGGLIRTSNKRLHSTLDDIAKNHQKTSVQVALNWVTTRDSVVAIPKADRPDHVREDIGSSGWRLREEEFKLLDEASK